MQSEKRKINVVWYGAKPPSLILHFAFLIFIFYMEQYIGAETLVTPVRNFYNKGVTVNLGNKPTIPNISNGVKPPILISWFTDIIKGFWTVLVGMGVTGKHLFRHPVTMHYPDEKWALPETFRGLLKCDIPACIVCDLCVKACPVDCITIEWKREEGKAGKTATKFEINYEKCMYCGLCSEPCPTNAIWHSQEYENSSETRDTMVIDWALPKNRVTNPKAKPPKPATAKPIAKPATSPATAHAPSTSTTAIAEPPTLGKPVSKVWIIEGCIVCDLCEDAAPEVFKIEEATSIVLGLDDYKPYSDKIIESAVGCPVNVIKYE